MWNINTLELILKIVQICLYMNLTLQMKQPRLSATEIYFPWKTYGFFLSGNVVVRKPISVHTTMTLTFMFQGKALKPQVLSF